MWKEATSTDGRKYYYNTNTNETTWEKPAGFVEQPPAPSEGGKQAAVWKEAKAADGRTYYYNTATNQTSWEKPAGYQAESTSGNDTSDRRIERRENFHAQAAPQRPGHDSGRPNGTPWEPRGDGVGFRGALPSKTDEPTYTTAEEAEQAFFKFLRSQHIKYDTPWADAIRAVGREKGYRALKDPKDRKQAFEKYCTQEKTAEKSREEERKGRQRDQFREMLRLHDDIIYSTRWKTARPKIERERNFKNIADEDEKKQLFREYIVQLQEQHAQQEKDEHDRALSMLAPLMRTLAFDPDVKWQDALESLHKNEMFANEKAFRCLNKVDLLKEYETQTRLLDAEKNDSKQSQKHSHVRKHRVARDAYKSLLREQLDAGNLRASSKWKDFHKLIKDDLRYQNMLGLAGSSPLDLFWDLLEEEEHRLRSARNDVYDVLEAQEFEITTSTDFDDFKSAMRKDTRTRSITTNDLVAIFERLLDKVKRRQQEERMLAEKELHEAIETLRSALKHVRPSIEADSSYEEVAARIKEMPEARTLDDEARRTAFEKYIRRLQDRSRRDRDRGVSRRSYDDDHRRRSRSPELDPYEEDRRKAQAARERQYRRASFGLAGSPRDRRDDRDRREHESIYERERRERELERERNYISRADPRDRGKISTLDYGDDDTGDSAPGSVRKRRESDVSTTGKRDSKRPRRSSRNDSTATKMEKEEKALQSGSEEGEIEEV